MSLFIRKAGCGWAIRKRQCRRRSSVYQDLWNEAPDDWPQTCPWNLWRRHEGVKASFSQIQTKEGLQRAQEIGSHRGGERHDDCEQGEDEPTSASGSATVKSFPIPAAKALKPRAWPIRCPPRSRKRRKLRTASARPAHKRRATPRKPPVCVTCAGGRAEDRLGIERPLHLG
jgi:hypothetical protein